MHDDRTPRGWPLPHADNYLEEDVARLREALSAADSAMTAVDTTLTDTTEALGQKADAAATRRELALKANTADVGQALSLKADAAVMAQALALKADNANGVERVDFGMDTGLGSCRIPATQHGFVMVRGVGLFFLDSEADDPADGETCILPAEGVSGRWMLLVPDVDWLFAFTKKENNGDELDIKLSEALVRIEALEKRKTLRLLATTAELTWPAIAQAGGTQERTIFLNEALVGDGVVVIPPAGLVAGLVFSGYVKSTNTVAVKCINVTGAAITPARANWTVKIVKEA